jgi:hypothetical protein
MFKTTHLYEELRIAKLFDIFLAEMSPLFTQRFCQPGVAKQPKRLQRLALFYA